MRGEVSRGKGWRWLAARSWTWIAVGCAPYHVVIFVALKRKCLLVHNSRKVAKTE